MDSDCFALKGKKPHESRLLVRRGPSGRALEVIERPGKVGRFGDHRTVNENLQDSLVIYDWQRGWRGGEQNQYCSGSLFESFEGLDNTIRVEFFSGNRKEHPVGLLNTLKRQRCYGWTASLVWTQWNVRVNRNPNLPSSGTPGCGRRSQRMYAGGCEVPRCMR